MGSEFAQFIEWDFQKGLDWTLLDYEIHRQMLEYNKKLFKLYKSEKALFERDTAYSGFKWLIVDDAVQNVIAFYREADDGERVIAVINFSGEKREKYRIPVPESGTYKVILNTNQPEFGGVTELKKQYTAKPVKSHGFNQSIALTVEPNAAVYLKLTNLPLKTK
jgi:1,4-alpha-glucan branching enzyme